MISQTKKKKSSLSNFQNLICIHGLITTVLGLDGVLNMGLIILFCKSIVLKMVRTPTQSPGKWQIYSGRGSSKNYRTDKNSGEIKFSHQFVSVQSGRYFKRGKSNQFALTSGLTKEKIKTFKLWISPTKLYAMLKRI